MRHAIATLLLAVAIAAAVYWLFGRDDSSEDEHSASATEVHSGTQAVVAHAAKLRGEEAADAERQDIVRLPRSLSDTDVDGNLTLINGVFVADAQALMLFDYFLSALGELTLEQIRTLIRREAESRVPADQVGQVMALFERYLRYREQAAQLSQRFGPTELAQHFEELQRLQQSAFGKDAVRMFNEQNLIAEDALARQRISSDPNLSDQERLEQLAQLDGHLPPEVRAARRKAQRPQEVAKTVEQMRADGLDEDEVFAYRADEFGVEAAERLRKLDEQRAAWNARMQAYQAELKQLAEDHPPGPARDEAIQALRAKHFDEREGMRVRVLDEAQDPQ